MKELEERMRREIEEVRAEMEEKIARLDRRMEELEQRVDRQSVGVQVGPLPSPEGGMKLAVRGSQYFFLTQSIALDPNRDSPLAAPRLTDDSAGRKAA